MRALVWVETESQKGILIGAGGEMIKAIGTAARKELERELGEQVHLELSVRVRRGWRADDALLDRLGIDVAVLVAAVRAAPRLDRGLTAARQAGPRLRFPDGACEEADGERSGEEQGVEGEGIHGGYRLVGW